jgi:hypothetical protein
MRRVLATALAFAVVAAVVRAEEPARQAPKVVLQSPDGKKSYDLGKLVEELAQFQKLQEAYNAKGLKTLAVFREKPESTSDYAAKKDIKFLWLSDPKGDLWKTFDTKAMPTNILIDKGGRVVKVLGGCTVDGKNAQALSKEIATLLKTDEVKVVEETKKK